MEVEIEGAARPGMVTKDGLMICGTDGRYQEQFEGNYLSLASWVVHMMVNIKNFKCNDLTGLFCRKVAECEVALSGWEVCQGMYLQRTQ